MLMDSLFLSFNEKVSMNSFQELSRCVISWLEEQCTPYALQDLMLHILEQVKKESHPQPQPPNHPEDLNMMNSNRPQQQAQAGQAGPPNVCITDVSQLQR